MAIVDDNIRVGLLVWDDPQTSDSVTNDFSKEDRALQVPVAKQAKAKEWVDNPFRKEDPTDTCRYVRKCVTYAPNNNILEDGCAAGKR